ncbi:TPA: glycine-rich domain-containing protein [Citrobacter amalonaticus]
MHRIDTATAQKDKFGAGKNGFTRGNPQTGTPATYLDNDYFDMLQEELCAVVEESGAELDKGEHNQLLTALRSLLLSRSNPFGDIASDGPEAIATALANLRLTEDAFGLQNCVVFDTAGVTSWNVPDVLRKGRKAWVIVIGGGASGSIGSVTAGGSGGAAGGESRKLVDLTGVSSVTVTVGAGGASVTTASTNGNAGSASSFGSYCSATGAPQSNVSSGQIGGVGTGGDINFRGAPSQPGILCSYVSNTQDRAGGTGGGEGGGAAQNGSAQFNSTAELQRDGASPGSGGAGVAPYSGGATTYRSGAGAPGAVYIIW